MCDIKCSRSCELNETFGETFMRFKSSLKDGFLKTDLKGPSILFFKQTKFIFFFFPFPACVYSLALTLE